MAKIGIYNEPFGAAIGGSEYLVAVLAEGLAKFHQVELIHHRSELNAAELEAFSGRDLRSVSLRYAPHKDHLFGAAHNPATRYQEAREWQSTLSAPYDLFIASLHNVPPFCHARKGMLIVLFPAYHRPYSQPSNEIQERPNPLWHSLSRAYHAWEWKQRMKSYQAKTAISSYTREWTRRLWSIDCQVIYPPAGEGFVSGEKENILLTVGRFAIAGEGHSKRQPEMLSAFRSIDSELKDWDYYSVGNLGQSVKHREFFDQLSNSAAESRAHVLANLERNEIKDLFARASIFWHAAGYGEDEETNPQLAEHFGIVTVEAMAAGCVPVVVNMGGQREIIEHGVSGYLWNDFDELKTYTLRLARDESLRNRMSEAARQRARMFSPEVFQQKYLDLVQTLLR